MRLNYGYTLNVLKIKISKSKEVHKWPVISRHLFVRLISSWSYINFASTYKGYRSLSQKVSIAKSKPNPNPSPNSNYHANPHINSNLTDICDSAQLTLCDNGPTPSSTGFCVCAWEHQEQITLQYKFHLRDNLI